MEPRHRHVIESLDTLIGFSRNLDARFDGKMPANLRQREAVPIFTKQVCHAITLRRLIPSEDTGETELWDVGSACAVGRCLIEAYDALAYYSLGDFSDAERDFRNALGKLHDTERRAKLLDLLGTTTPEAELIRTAVPNLRRHVLEHEVFPHIGEDIKKKIRSGDAPLYGLSQRQRNEAAGLDHRHHQIATVHLSQFVHTAPMAINQWRSFAAGGVEEMRQMILPAQYSLPYLAMGVVAMLGLFTDVTPLPEDVSNTLDFWLPIARHGVPGRNAEIVTRQL